MSAIRINSPNLHRDLQKFEKVIEAYLNEIGTKNFSLAFAGRMALIALPMLVEGSEERGFLWYWPAEDREKHLLAVCRVPQVAFLLAVDDLAFHDAYVLDAYDIYFDAAYAAYAAIDTSANAAANAVYAEARYDIHDTATYAARAAAHVAHAAFLTGIDITGFIKKDLAMLARAHAAVMGNDVLFPSLVTPFPDRLRLLVRLAPGPLRGEAAETKTPKKERVVAKRDRKSGAVRHQPPSAHHQSNYVKPIIRSFRKLADARVEY